MENQNNPVAPQYEQPQPPQAPQAPQQPQYAPQQPQYAPQQPQPQYAQPQYPQYAPVRQSNGLGIAGFVVSLVALLFCWLPYFNAITALTAVILSAIGLKKLPKGLAIAGLIIGGLVLIASIIWIVILVTAVSNAYYW